MTKDEIPNAPADAQRAPEQAVLDRFRAAADGYFDYLLERWQDTVAKNAEAEDAVLLAELMTMHDGYNDVELGDTWDGLPTIGWQTTFVANAKVGREVIPYAFQVRYGDHARQLAVLVDRQKPGLRTATKRQHEARLEAMGFAVLSLTALEIGSDPEECRVRVECALANLVDATLVDAGVIPGSKS